LFKFVSESPTGQPRPAVSGLVTSPPFATLASSERLQYSSHAC